MLSGTSFELGADFSVRASVIDDYGVESVSLYYELTDGSYASAPMLEVDGSYVAIIPADSLWDGMDVYFACNDVAGNGVLGHYAQLTEATPSSGSRSPTGYLSSTGGMFFLGAVGIISLMSLLFVSKRRDKDEETRHGSSVRDMSSIGVARPLSTPSGRPIPSAPASNGVSARVQAAEKGPQSGQIARTWDAVAPSDSRRPRVPPTLIDSIPDIRLGDRQEEREIDYGDLIERELIIPSIKYSVFRESVKDRDSGIELQLEELRAMIANRPKKTVE